MYKFIFILILYTFAFDISGQSILNLETCLQRAMANNSKIKIAGEEKNIANTAIAQNRLKMLPDVSLSSSVGMSIGRSINPFTNSFINQNLNFTNVGLQINAVLFSGGRITNSIKKSKIDNEVAYWNKALTEQELEIEVITNYAQMVSLHLQKDAMERRLLETKKQLDRLTVLHDQGQGAPTDVLNFKAQLAADEVSLMDMDNQLVISSLNLAKLLNSEEQFEIDYSEEEIVISDFNLPSFDEAYLIAAKFSPSLMQAEKLLASSKKQRDILKADFFPSLSLFGQLNSNYSSTAERFNATGLTSSPTGDYVDIDNQRLSVLRDQATFESEIIPFFNQLNNNLNSAIGLSLNIPINNYFSTKYNLIQQKARIHQQEENYENNKNLFYNNLKNAYNNYNQHETTVPKLKDKLMLYEEIYRLEEVKFNNGVSNLLSLITAKNNKDQARMVWINATIQARLWKRIIFTYLKDRKPSY